MEDERKVRVCGFFNVMVYTWAGFCTRVGVGLGGTVGVMLFDLSPCLE